MKNRFVPHLAWLAVIGFCLAGCHSNPDKLDRPENPFKSSESGPGKAPLSDRELRAKADQLYRRAHDSLDSSDYSTAITRYDDLIARYPFSDYSTQAELEKIYAQYKSFLADDATTAADRFLRAHPRHPHADYVLYLKGLTDFGRDSGVLSYISLQTSKRDVGNQLRAFEDFSLLLQKYPKSVYAGDARRRMLYARNRIADHELSVAQFYVSRGAYVAAAKRASDMIMQYPGAPATIEALKVLQESDTKLGLDQQAKDAEALIAANTGKVEFTDPPPPRTIVMARDPEPAHRAHGKQAAAPDDAASPAPPASAPAAPPAAPPAGAPAPTPAPGQTSLAPSPELAAQPVLLAEADQADQQSGQQSEQPAAHPGIFTKFANLFSPLDTSKPENQHVYVIGGSSGKSPAAAAPAAATAAAPANENADAPANAPSAPASSGLKFHLRAHMPGDDDDTAPPTAQPAPAQS